MTKYSVIIPTYNERRNIGILYLLLREAFAHPSLRDDEFEIIVVDDNSPDGTADGSPDGTADGSPDGTADGCPDGSPDGTADGCPDGTADGSPDGTADGSPDGTADEIGRASCRARA